MVNTLSMIPMICINNSLGLRNVVGYLFNKDKIKVYCFYV